MENQRQQAVEYNAPGTTAPVAGNTVPQENAAPVNAPSSFGANPNTGDFPPPPQRQDYTTPQQPPADPVTRQEREGAAGHHAGPGIINKAKGVVAQTHGLGENLRGNFNAAVDTAFNDKKGQRIDEATASKGEREVINKQRLKEDP